MIKDNIIRIENHIASVCSRLGKDPKEVTLVGITKYADVTAINEVLAAGLNHIGENKVQQAKDKFTSIESQEKITKHMVGHLQTNKVKLALVLFDMIQSVDSLKLATEINKQAEKLKRKVNILIEVNSSGEEQKFGLNKQQVLPLLKEIEPMQHLSVLGLMTMAPYEAEEKIIRQCFSSLRILFDQIKDQYSSNKQIEMKHLSMGMTNDYEIALEEGANMLRIGRAIFT